MLVNIDEIGDDHYRNYISIYLFSLRSQNNPIKHLLDQS